MHACAASRPGECFCVFMNKGNSYDFWDELRLFEVLVVEHLESAVGHEYAWHLDAVGRLVVLEDGGDDAGQGEGRAVEGVAQLNLLVVGVTVAAVQAVGLIALKVRHGAYLEPAALGGAPGLEVVADGRGEAHVATAETEDVIGELQLLQQALYVGQHLLERLVRVLRGVDAYDLHLVELMQAVQAAHVLAVRAGLAAEAGRVGAALDGQVLLVEDHVAVDVGDRHLSRRDEVEVVKVGVVHLALLVGQLAGAQSAGLIHHVGRLYLQVAGLAGLIEEESLQRALEAGHLADIYWEAGAGDLHAEVEVHEVVFLQQVPVAQGVRTQLGLHAAFFHYHVVGCVLTLGHVIIGDVRDGEEHLGHVVLCLVHHLLEGLVVGLQLGNLFLYLGGFVFLAFFHQTADLLGQLVLLLLVRIELLLAFTTDLVIFQYLLNGLARTVEVLLLQTFDHTFSFLTDEFECKHIAVSLVI